MNVCKVFSSFTSKSFRRLASRDTLLVTLGMSQNESIVISNTVVACSLIIQFLQLFVSSPQIGCNKATIILQGRLSSDKFNIAICFCFDHIGHSHAMWYIIL